jgi:hypothetical protein
MAEVFNNIFVRGLTGAVGDQFVIRRTRSGKTIIANKPRFDKNREFTPAQKAHQNAFREAARYAKAAQTRPFYIEKAKAANSTSYNMAVADWFGKPEVLAIDASGWTGESGQTIRIEAQDDTKVTRVTVVIHNNGSILEQGEAVPSETDGSLWTYITTSQMTPARGILLDANAYDLPGNFGSSSVPMN